MSTQPDPTAPFDPTRRFLRPEEVAQELNVTVSQVYTLMRSGQLAAVKIGKRGVWRVSREQLEAYVGGLEQEAVHRIETGTPLGS